MKDQKEKKLYEIFNVKYQKLMRIEAVDLTDAAGQVRSYWPCLIKAKHLSYRFVGVDTNGTLDFTDGKSGFANCD